MTIRQSDIVGIDPLRQPSMRDFADGLKVRRVLPSSNRLMIGPYILFDHFGPAVFDAGRGFDMGPHPHIGIAAVTYLFDGEIIHHDNLGEVQTIRPGEVNWMTAGSGIVHSERTSPEARAPGSNLFGVQAWVALPTKHEEVAAHFSHYGAPEIPRICGDGVEFTLIAGVSDGLVSPARTYSDLVCAEIVLTSSARYQVKPGYLERAIYVVAGEIEVMGQLGTFGEGELIMLEPDAEIVLQAPAFHAARLMLIGGEPLSEPRYVHWNFVSSSAERIEQAKADWREGRFPDVPGEHGLMPLPQEE
ncbi:MULTISPECIES: pirin family protein [unclassified Mesorhizobium]|uniref:pirin family protein n=1 Tax=unclassified Mesorhizobium TaxID=325217 RepID=UPI00112600EC|nr:MULTISPECIES: pirin family protein [unclassified Mesorhizobium]TPJ45972.1 pirin family protein [Mesorhizobium sp. B2-6-6]MCA0008459.1 pirin family protein [Mesorhizobium sp. B264B1B]MCA0021333.1 pirin family protein [Mesorhizobium sp. B264B1A]MCA0026344.1 pirin family protein [Mesorhizobium sp. B263B1A]MCA0056748.1 pirin family protein [Mesorhizobium sp. B261B1A]